MTGKVDFVPRMRAEIPDLRGWDVLEGCGHWTQQERPQDVNTRLLSWLDALGR
jgi:pimeloyl-ACP methyl ester carboxylesterase